MGLLEGLVAIVGLAALTLLTRGFFFLLPREVELPHWLAQGLRVAPLAALVAIAAPDIVTNQGQWLGTWADARPWAALAAAGWYFWRRGILGTIVCGTSVLVALRLGLGW